MVEAVGASPLVAASDILRRKGCQIKVGLKSAESRGLSEGCCDDRVLQLLWVMCGLHVGRVQYSDLNSLQGSKYCGFDKEDSRRVERDKKSREGEGTNTYTRVYDT